MSYWELILQAAFATIGTIEYLKGFKKDSPTMAWRILQPVLCLFYATLFQHVPIEVRIGVMALALSTLGYQSIIKAVKNKIGAPGETA